MRILLVPLFAFTLGWLLSAAVAVPDPAAALFAVVGCLASAMLVRRRFAWPVVTALGFLAGICWFSGARPALSGPSVFVEIVGEDRVDLLVEARVTEGPRFWTDSVVYELAIMKIDGRAIDAEPVRLWISHPGDDELLWPGDSIEIFARASRYDPASFPRVDGAREMMGRRGIVGRLVAREAPTLLESEPTLARLAAKNRVKLERFVERAAPSSAPMIIAMLTGSRGGLTDRTWEAFRDTGTAHVLAISGLHFGVLSALLWALGTAIARRSIRVCRTIGARRFTSMFVLCTMGLYLLMVGAPVSAVRAWVAVGVAVAALWALRRPSVFAALCVAAVALSAAQPAIVLDLGFQLSFVATLSITTFWYRRPAWLRRDPFAFEKEPRHRTVLRGVACFVGISWAASAATAPILWNANGMISVTGPLVNLVVVPWVSSVLFPLIVAGALGSAVFPAAGNVAFEGADILLQATQSALVAISSSWWCVWIPGVGPVWLAIVMLAIVFGVLWRGVRAGDLLVVLMLSAAFVAWAEDRRATPPDGVRVHFIPVGQGDSTLLEGPEGMRILVDAGGSPLGRDPGRHIVVPYLRRLGITQLDAIIVTHEDIDHAGGVPAVVELTRVDRVLREPTDLGLPWLELRRFDVLGSENEQSITARVALGRASVFLTGDIESRAEAAAVRTGGIESLILKVPHHGSKTSSGPEFLDAVRPHVAIVSAGRHNRFGHPHPDVVQRYDERAVRLFSTAMHGLVIVELGHNGDVRVFTMD